MRLLLLCLCCMLCSCAGTQVTAPELVSASVDFESGDDGLETVTVYPHMIWDDQEVTLTVTWELEQEEVEMCIELAPLAPMCEVVSVAGDEEEVMPEEPVEEESSEEGGEQVEEVAPEEETDES